MNDYEGTEKLEGDFYDQFKEASAVICGTIGSGKTTYAKKIFYELVDEYKGTQTIIRIFDPIGNWFFNFRSDVSSQIIRRDNEPCVDHNIIVYWLQMDSEHERRAFIQRVLKRDLDHQRQLYKNKEGDKDKLPKIFYLIEEASTVLSTYSLREGFFKDFVAFSRNYNIATLYITQRLAECSPKVVEKIPNLAIGQAAGANDLRRIKSIIPKSKYEGVDFNKQFRFQLYFDGCLFPYDVSKFKGKKTEQYIVLAEQKGYFRRRTEYKVYKWREVNEPEYLRLGDPQEQITTQEANDYLNEAKRLYDTLNHIEPHADSEDIDSESEIEIDESEEYPEEY